MADALDVTAAGPADGTGPAPPMPSSDRSDPVTGRDAGEIQRRTLAVLMVVVAMGGAGAGGAFSLVSVLANEITGSELLSGIAAAGMATGAAIAAVPLAKLMARSGRRVGLRGGYLVALAGALLTLTGGLTGVFPLVVVGMLGVGTGTACGLAARFAVVDLAAPADRARTIGLLVGATTAGAIAGPTLATGPATSVATSVGLDELAGPFLFAAVAFALAALILDRGLHPDPLLVARRLGGGSGAAPGRAGLVRSLGLIARSPAARLATVAMMVGQGVMVSTMVMAPLHMTDGDQTIRVIGFVISTHIVGMYALAPLVGWATGRLGPTPMIVAGGVISFLGAEISAHTPPEVAWGMFAGMFGVGLGWNCCLVAGTALFTSAVPAEDRVPVQGAADLLMSATGGAGGIIGGAVVVWQDFQFLSHYSGLFGAVLAGVATLAYFGRTPGISRRVVPNQR
ncbi:MAG: MFS transporter [bacterium]|nr:MFS transporter [bacterium]